MRKNSGRRAGRPLGAENVLPTALDLSIELTASYQAEIDFNLFVMRGLNDRIQFLKRRIESSRQTSTQIERRRSRVA